MTHQFVIFSSSVNSVFSLLAENVVVAYLHLLSCMDTKAFTWPLVCPYERIFFKLMEESFTARKVKLFHEETKPCAFVFDSSPFEGDDKLRHSLVCVINHKSFLFSIMCTWMTLLDSSIWI
jgi:hypothetical protein